MTFAHTHKYHSCDIISVPYFYDNVLFQHVSLYLSWNFIELKYLYLLWNSIELKEGILPKNYVNILLMYLPFVALCISCG